MSNRTHAAGSDTDFHKPPTLYLANSDLARTLYLNHWTPLVMERSPLAGLKGAGGRGSGIVQSRCTTTSSQLGMGIGRTKVGGGFLGSRF